MEERSDARYASATAGRTLAARSNGGGNSPGGNGSEKSPRRQALVISRACSNKDLANLIKGKRIALLDAKQIIFLPNFVGRYDLRTLCLCSRSGLRLFIVPGGKSFRNLSIALSSSACACESERFLTSSKHCFQE